MSRTAAHFFEYLAFLFAMLAIAAWVADRMEAKYRKPERKRWSNGKGALR